MGTRYEDQPVEQWAGPESLDPTPVWKQYVLVAALLAVGLIVVLIAAVPALAPGFVTPPALVLGDRLVLASSEVRADPNSPTYIGAPLVGDSRSFFLVQPTKGTVIALRAHWRESPDSTECTLQFIARAGRFACDGGDGTHGTAFNIVGEPAGECGTRRCPSRGLDRYLVSVSGDRVIVNLSRVIESSERTSGPVPTGIPQPQTQAP